MGPTKQEFSNLVVELERIISTADASFFLEVNVSRSQFLLIRNELLKLGNEEPLQRAATSIGPRIILDSWDDDTAKALRDRISSWYSAFEKPTVKRAD